MLPKVARVNYRELRSQFCGLPTLVRMPPGSSRKAFAERLREAMKDAGYSSKRDAKSGVDVAPLAAAAGVKREMARRYVEAIALPDVERMIKIAQWLGVRIQWLRDGEEPQRANRPLRLLPAVEQEVATYLSDEAVEIANLWLKLPPGRREMAREILALSVMCARENGLRFQADESFEDFERRIVRDYRLYQRVKPR